MMSGFTMPGETGCEQRVLELAKRWGADALRDSDGTELPRQIKESGYPIYSTVCLIRGDNAFAREHPDMVQQMFLITPPAAAHGDTLSIRLMASFAADTYKVNAAAESVQHWQVFDRTTGEELPRERWRFNQDAGTVDIAGTARWHRYTVTFLGYEIWEFVNRYNHRTNNWTTEPEIPLDPRHPQVRARIKERLAAWLECNAHCSVVRFTSFYYFSGLGGWGDYGRSVSPLAFKEFTDAHGYCPKGETFVNGGLYASGYLPPSREMKDWIGFVNTFVIETMKPYIDMVHAAGKQAMFLLGDHWVGSEPMGERFATLGMDGVIKSVFNGFEARIAGAVDAVPVKEIRFHPYFFPKEVTGKPTFCAEGTPTEDLKLYWRDVRRAALRTRIDRIGFGGYISLLDAFPDFVDYVAAVSRQSAAICDLHRQGPVHMAGVNVGVLTCWGQSRAWMCNGHMQHGSAYNHFLESLAGLPVNVEFLSFEQIRERGIPRHINVLANCGREGTAWSGGDVWRDAGLVEMISAFVADGGGLIGIGEPSACTGFSQYFQLAHVLGTDREVIPGELNCRYDGYLGEKHFIAADMDGELAFLTDVTGLRIVSGEARIIASRLAGDCEQFYVHRQPQVVVNRFANGRAVYFSGYKYDVRNTRVLHRALFWAAGMEHAFDAWRCSNPWMECAYFPAANALAVVNNSHETQATTLWLAGGEQIRVSLAGLQMDVVQIG